MAKRNGNGHKGNGVTLADVVTELQGIGQILRGHGKQIRALREETHAGFADLRSELAKTNAGLADLRGEVHEGFAELGSKITSAIERDRRLEE